MSKPTGRDEQLKREFFQLLKRTELGVDEAKKQDVVYPSLYEHLTESLQVYSRRIGRLVEEQKNLKTAVKKTGYQAFGSFFSENPKVLIERSDKDYVVPPLPFDLPELLSEEKENKGQAIQPPISFGREFGKYYFKLDPSWTFLNHGAFGAPSRVLFEVANSWRLWLEEQPVASLDRWLLPYLVYSIRQLARYINAAPRDLVLVKNATTAMSVVFSSLHSRLTAGDVIYSLDIGYGSVKKAIENLCTITGATHYEAKVHFPLASPLEVVELVKQTMPPSTKFAVFDHITSNTAFLLPIQHLISVCRQRGVKVIIDGAHGLGMVPLDMGAIDADFYVSNMHKWFCNPRGCAFLWVRSDQQQFVKPLVISHGFGSGFLNDFLWTGNEDYSPWLCVPATISFFEKFIGKRGREYAQKQLVWAVEMLSKMWSTESLLRSDCYVCMALIRLPRSAHAKNKLVETSDDAKYVQDLLHYQFRIEVPIKCIEGQLYVRISSFVYNYPEQYYRLGEAVRIIRLEGAKL